jgi:hypothetical protein
MTVFQIQPSDVEKLDKDFLTEVFTDSRLYSPIEWEESVFLQTVSDRVETGCSCFFLQKEGKTVGFISGEMTRLPHAGLCFFADVFFLKNLEQKEIAFFLDSVQETLLAEQIKTIAFLAKKQTTAASRFFIHKLDCDSTLAIYLKNAS